MAALADDVIETRVATYRECGLNVSAAARALGIARQSMQGTLDAAKARNMLADCEIHDANTPSTSEYQSARVRKIASFQKKAAKGDWRKPKFSRLPDQPFRLKVFGDPHLDSDGCDYELFERHWLEMDAANGVYGVCVGDWFNNWPRVLAHLWKGEGDPDDAWLCLEYLMEQRGAALIAACSGNHDDWTHGPADPVDLLMKKYGVLYRKGAIRIILGFEKSKPVTIGMRHKWRGSSMYSAAHGILRAGIFGWRDHIMIGGHIHQDESRMLSHPDGYKSHICQVSAFKRFDEFADVQGFMGPKISPVWDLVIDPARDESDPERVKVFWDSGSAAGYLAYLRGRA